MERVESFDKSMRVRVLIDVRNPLKQVLKLKVRGGDALMVTVKYEKLPLYCFVCGRLGHGERDCEEGKGDRSPVRHFSSELRASPWKSKLVKSNLNDGNVSAGARRFFTPKPECMGKEKPPKLNEVLSKLNEVNLSVNASGGIEREVGTEVTGGGWEHAQREGDSSHLEGPGVTESVEGIEGVRLDSGEVVKVGRKWKRIQQEEMRLSVEGDPLGGKKRRAEEDAGEMENDVDNERGNMVKKRCLVTGEDVWMVNAYLANLDGGDPKVAILGVNQDREEQ